MSQLLETNTGFDATGFGLSLPTTVEWVSDLSETSALVPLWARTGCYQSDAANAYLQTLDLTAGEPLFRECEAICPYYAEVIRNRKFGVLRLVAQCCAAEQQELQIVIVGAGLDAMGIEITERHTHARVFELDIDAVPVKVAWFANRQQPFLPN